MKLFTFSLLFLLLSLVMNAQTAGVLSVSVTTAPTGYGGYDPANVEAIWIEDNDGNFVKTLLVYGSQRIYNLNLWVDASNSNKVDAVTGATKTSHAARSCSWNATNVSRTVVADGVYKLKMQLTDDEIPGENASFTFTKSTTPQLLTPADVLPCFKNISINWVPANTAIDNISVEDQYTIYPNPTKSTVYVSGFDIKKIELMSVNGKTISTSLIQNVSLTDLPKGFYLLKINSDKRTFIKKVEKI